VGEFRTHVARAGVVAAVLATGIACTGPVRAAATAAGTVSSRGAPAVSSPGQPCSNPSDSVLAIRVATSTLERVIKVGRGAFPDAIAITPNGKTAYVTLASNDEVLPVSIAANKPGRAVKVGVFPDALAITPNGRTVYVANDGSDTVTPISTATDKPARAVKVGVSPGVIGITPNGRTVYVGNGLVEQLPSRTPLNAVVPISTATDSAGRVLLVAAGTKHPGSADAFAFSRDSKTAYVAVAGTDEVDPIRVAGGTLGRAIQAGTDPGPVVITPNGKTAYVADLGSDTVTPVSTATGRPGKAITVGAKLGPQATTAAIALTPNGKTLYVATNSNAAAEDDTVTPVSTATNRPGKAIRVGSGIDAIAITPNGKTAYAASFNAGRVTPIRIATNTAGKPIAVGTDVGPITMAITPNSATVYVADVATCASAEPSGDPSAAEEPGHASYGSLLTSGSSAAAAAASRRSTCPAALARAAASPSRECTGETASA
jgi:YVTN family beta-propeller protein